MHSGDLMRYQNLALREEDRLRAYFEGEERLTWVSLFLADHEEAGAYLVGGTVRDVLLGLYPSDADLVIRGIAFDQLRAWLNRHGALTVAGERFQTLKFIPHGAGNREPVDIALPRTEMVGEESGGRGDQLVHVDPMLSIEADLSRRDFTVNAIAYDMRDDMLIDPFAGLRDLATGIIRAVGSPYERYAEDATRILRALRFSARLRFAIEGETWEAIKTLAHLLQNTRTIEDGTHRYVIPRDLIGREFLLGFFAHPMHTLKLWDETGVLKLYLPDVYAFLRHEMEDGTSGRYRLKALYEVMFAPGLLKMYGFTKPPNEVVVAALGIFLDDKSVITNASTHLFFHQFAKRHSAHVATQEIAWLLANHDLFSHYDPASMRPSHFERTLLGDRGAKLFFFLHAISLATGRHGLEEDRLHTARMLRTRILGASGRLPPALISGSDIAAIGLSAGPVYRDILDGVRDAQLAGRAQTKEEALRLARQLIDNLNSPSLRV